MRHDRATRWPFGRLARVLKFWATGMFGRIRVSRWLFAAAVLALAEGSSVLALGLALTQPAQAQWFGDDSYRRPRAPRSNGGFFQNLFGPFNERSQQNPGYYPPEQRRVQQPVDNSRAPPPHKPDAKAEPVVPTTSIVVMGDGMADSAGLWAGRGFRRIPRKLRSCARTNCIRVCCATTRKAISIGGTRRATFSRRRSPTTSS